MELVAGDVTPYCHVRARVCVVNKGLQPARHPLFQDVSVLNLIVSFCQPSDDSLRIEIFTFSYRFRLVNNIMFSALIYAILNINSKSTNQI